jgi:hypothetical protein
MILRLSSVLAVITILASTSVASADGPILLPFSAEYKIRVSFVRGKWTTILRRNASGDYVLETRARVAGLIGLFVRKGIEETSRFAVREGRVQPLSFKRVDTISDDERDMELEFDWTNGKVLRRYDDISEELEIPGNALDPSLLSIAIMVDRMHGQAPGPYTLIERDRTELIEIIEEGPETTKTRAGQFSTLRYSHYAEALDRTTRLWASPETRYITVRMEQYDSGKKRATLELTELSIDDNLDSTVEP